MAVSNQTPRNVSVATAGATVFPYNFKVTRASDLLVRVNGVTKTLGVHYTVDGVGQDSGGNITFLTPMAGGESVMRRRNMAFTRETDYQNLGDLRSATLNNDQDEPVLMIQQIGEQVSRAVAMPDDLSGVDPTLPMPDPSKLLGWNADGSGLRNTDPDGPGDLLLRSDLADPTGGGLLVAYRNEPGEVPRTVADKLYWDGAIVIKDIAPKGLADYRAYVQAKLNQAASETRKGAREFVLRGFEGQKDFPISHFIAVGDNTRLIFDGDTRLVPADDATPDFSVGECIRSHGALPTSYVALDADALIGEWWLDVVDTAPFAVGQHVWISDTAIIITSPNTRDLTQAQMAKIAAVEAGRIWLDRSIEYNFSAATAQVGVMDCRTGIVIEGFQWGDPTMTKVAGRGLDLRYHDGLVVRDASGGWSRAVLDPDAAYETQNMNFINLHHCSNAVVERVFVDRAAYYGVNINGASHNVAVRDVTMRLGRHAVDINWNGPGEPMHVLVENVVGHQLTLSAIDTHDVGRDLTFRKVRCVGGKGDAAQVRTSNVLLDDIVGRDCGGHGLFVHCQDQTKQSLLQNVRATNLRFARMGGWGVKSFAPVQLEGLVLTACGTANGDGSNMNNGGGVMLPAGLVRDANITFSRGPAFQYLPDNVDSSVYGPLLLDNVTAPKSATQTVFLYSPRAYADRNVRLRDVTAVGYDADKIVARSGSTVISDIDHRGCIWGSTGKRYGAATLVAGTVTVTTDQVVRSASTNTLAGRFRSIVRVQRIADGGTVGNYTVTLGDGQFTITSSSSTDTSVIEWWIE